MCFFLKVFGGFLCVYVLYVFLCADVYIFVNMYMHVFVCMCFTCESLCVCVSVCLDLCLSVFVVYMHGCVYKGKAWQRPFE